MNKKFAFLNSFVFDDGQFSYHCKTKGLNKYLEDLKDIGIPNNAENIEAFIGTSGRKKMLSNVATRKTIENGFTAKDHYTAIANIEKLFMNAIKANERDSYDSSNSIKSIEHFTSLFMLEGKPALTTFTVKNTLRDGRRIYSIELIDIKKPEGILPSAVNKRLSASSGFDTLNISKISEIVNNTSKVVDENGEPLLVYHGTENGGHYEFNPDEYARSEPVTWFGLTMGNSHTIVKPKLISLQINLNLKIQIISYQLLK